MTDRDISRAIILCEHFGYIEAIINGEGNTFTLVTTRANAVCVWHGNRKQTLANWMDFVTSGAVMTPYIVPPARPCGPEERRWGNVMAKVWFRKKK